MNAEVASRIEVGRRVRFFAGYGGTDGEGLIVAVHGTPNPAPAQSLYRGVGRVIRPTDCTVDVILFDGRYLSGNHQCGIDAPGIGIKLLDRVHGPRLIEVTKRRAAEKAAADQIAAVQAFEKHQSDEAARKIDDPPLFYWNGIKDAKGAKLQKASYSVMTHGSVTAKFPAGTITIYARDYSRFSDKVRACFLVENDTDSMVDYFDHDKIRVVPTHPLYAQVLAAVEAGEARWKRRQAKRAGGAA